MREVMLILHFLGLTMGLGTSFAHLFLSGATSKMSADEAGKFQLRTLALTRMGHIGLALLLISGLYLITPYWKVISSMPMLIVKLSLVALLITLISIISIAARKAQKSGSPDAMKKIIPIGKVTFIVGIAIVIIAVYVFR
jgi:uncharacterized membrane protein